MTQPEDKTYLAIDYGRRRIGVAKSDPTGLIASPIETIEVRSNQDAVEKLAKIKDVKQPGTNRYWLRCPTGQSWTGLSCEGGAEGRKPATYKAIYLTIASENKSAVRIQGAFLSTKKPYFLALST